VNDYRTLKLLEAFAECARHSNYVGMTVKEIEDAY